MGRSVGVCSEPVQDEDVVGIRIQCNYRFSSDISLYALLFFPRPALSRLVLSLQSIHYILHARLSVLSGVFIQDEDRRRWAAPFQTS